MMLPMDSMGEILGAGRGPSPGRILGARASSDDLLVVLVCLGAAWTLLYPQRRFKIRSTYVGE
jgi:hypothetical protein